MRSVKERTTIFFKSGLNSCFLNICVLILAISATLLSGKSAFAQADQGAITGTVFDPQGAVVANANVTVTNVDTGFEVTTKTNDSGNYVFSPLKIGHYTVRCAAKGFKTETETGLMLNVQARLDVNCHLSIGQASESVSVQAGSGPLLETQQSTTGQVFSTETINETPLNQRNYVFVAQLAAGVEQTPGAAGSRAQGNGDFDANGQSFLQNDFILDGVDNNSSAIDFMNGASYVIKPPPDALSEFNVQTGDYSAELGHSAGAVINASIKSGTNNFHGDAWEYVRNDAFDAKSYFTGSQIPEYRQNQFGATIGGPFIKNHLFFFGDFEANRIVIGNSGLYTVPTMTMRQSPGNFSEFLTGSNNSDGNPHILYEPGSGGTARLGSACENPANVMCKSEVSPVVANLFTLFPKPNFGTADQTYNNLLVSLNQFNTTAQWDARVDWNVTAHDQAYSRLSISNNPIYTPDPYGSEVDGGGYGSDGGSRLSSKQFEVSETHVFSPSFINEIRFGFTYGAWLFQIADGNTDVSKALGFGGIPYSSGIGGLPWTQISDLGFIGPTCCVPAAEHANNGELLDNVTKIVGNHALKVGFQTQLIRSGYQAGAFDRGWYVYNGLYTAIPGVADTGSGMADFMSDEQASNEISNVGNANQYRWYRAAYIQDDWKVKSKLTVNLGLRYDRFNPLVDKHDNEANFVITGTGFNATTGLGSGTANFLMPNGKSIPNSGGGAIFLANAAADKVTIQNSGNAGLVNAQNLNFSPRIGFAYTFMPETVVRAGYGIFFGGLENGYGTNLTQNYPFVVQSTVNAPSCFAGSPCTTDGIHVATGWYTGVPWTDFPIVSVGLESTEYNVKTPYTENWNLTVERALNQTMTATVAYVGATARHIQENNWQGNDPMALTAPGTNTVPMQPFPNFGADAGNYYIASSNYHSLQASFQKHYSHGLQFLAAYTWSHSLDDEPGNANGSAAENLNVIPLKHDYGPSDWDVRQRFTLNGNYQLPFGLRRQFLNRKGAVDYLVGGWSINTMFVAETGSPFEVKSDNPSPAGLHYGSYTVRAVRIGDPFKGGGTPPNSLISSCPSQVKTTQHWFNPCAFTNPKPGTDIAPGQYITTYAAALPFLGGGKNQLTGPGYNRLNTSVFKRFPTFREQYLEFRADIFNTYNSPAYGTPEGDDTTNGGLITGTRSVGANSPDGRFVQLALKYVF